MVSQPFLPPLRPSWSRDVCVGYDVLCFRDTVGTERFDSITTQYYRGGAVCQRCMMLQMKLFCMLLLSFSFYLHVQGIIIVYDITSTQSFNQLIKWIGYIHSVSTLCLCVCVCVLESLKFISSPAHYSMLLQMSV